jgi:MFS family permease
VMVLFARLSGKLFDRVGARLPLILGPAVAGLGFGLIAILGGDAPYFAFIIGAAILGLGMVISIPPLTATVINSVSPHRVGVASGINNASAQLANLLAIAIFGAIALHDIDASLDGRVAVASSAEVRAAIVEAHGKFIVAPPPASLAPNLRHEAETAVRESLADGIRRAVWLTALLAFAASVMALVTIPGRPKTPAAGTLPIAPPG